MPYNLLFSRNRTTDAAVRFEDVPITSASFMVDALSVLSQFRRSAGWLYPIRQATSADFERGEGRLILFGKNRVVFDDFPAPYYLEFFPRWGMRNYILSFYEGTPDASPGSPGWVNLVGGGWNVNYEPATLNLLSRNGGSGSPEYLLDSGVMDAYAVGGQAWYRKDGGLLRRWAPYDFALDSDVGESEYEAAISSPGSVRLS
jgi:hypothetical protein